MVRGNSTQWLRFLRDEMLNLNTPPLTVLVDHPDAHWGSPFFGETGPHGSVHHTTPIPSGRWCTFPSNPAQLEVAGVGLGKGGPTCPDLISFCAGRRWRECGRLDFAPPAGGEKRTEGRPGPGFAHCLHGLTPHKGSFFTAHSSPTLQAGVQYNVLVHQHFGQLVTPAHPCPRAGYQALFAPFFFPAGFAPGL